MSRSLEMDSSSRRKGMGQCAIQFGLLLRARTGYRSGLFLRGCCRPQPRESMQDSEAGAIGVEGEDSPTALTAALHCGPVQGYAGQEQFAERSTSVAVENKTRARGCREAM